MNPSNQPLTLDWERLTFTPEGLIPAIVQDARTKEVLTLAYMNRESLQLTMERGETWFYSRSRQQLWHKGETSGNTQRVVGIRPDCDGDALLVQVIPNGPACHQGTTSCFGESEGEMIASTLHQLEGIIAERQGEKSTSSYTARLLNEGLDRILKKVGEEAAEVIIAAKNRSNDELTYETADLLYHLLVLLRHADLSLDEIFRELERRMDKKNME